LSLLTLAWRSIWRNRRRTLITVSSIGLGLFLAVCFIAFADGIYAKLIDDAVRIQAGHVLFEHPAYRDAPAADLVVQVDVALRRRLEGLPEVERTKALVLGQGVAKSAAGAVGVALLGVEPAVEVHSSPLAARVEQGSYLDDPDAAEVLIGAQLAAQLELTPGKKLVLATNDVHGDLVEELARVKGVFRLGAEEFDGFFVQVPIGFARRLYDLGPDQATQLGVLLRDADDQPAMQPRLAQWVDPRQVVVRGWDEVMPELASYIRVDGGSNYVLQVILLVLIFFTIFNTLLMSVLERRREFAVLLALGTPPARLRLQILAESALIGLLGCLVGLSLGAAVAGYYQVHGLDLRSLMPEGATISGFAMSLRVHPRLTLELLAWLGGLVFGVTLLLGLYPMQRATQVPVADVLR